MPEAKKSPTVVSAALFQNMSSRIIGGYVETVDRVTSQQLVLRAVGLTSVSSSLKQTIALNFLKRGN